VGQQCKLGHQDSTIIVQERARTLMDTRAIEYLQAIAFVLDEGYPQDCVTHACRLVELLLAEGESPSIGLLRDITYTPQGVLHGPLTPKQLSGRHSRTWTTHYVACAGGRVFDPLLGMPVAVDAYSIAVFGRPIDVQTFLDANATAQLSRAGELRAALFNAR
jgi:hypothetical protein